MIECQIIGQFPGCEDGIFLLKYSLFNRHLIHAHYEAEYGELTDVFNLL